MDTQASSASSDGQFHGGKRSLKTIAVAFIFLTRLPVRIRGEITEADLTRSLAAYPLVGMIVNLLGGLVFAGAMYLELSPLVAASLALVTIAATTGGFHQDALCDVADGFGGGKTRDEKLAIMRDSRIGSFAATALILVTLVKVAALDQIGYRTGAGGGLLALMAAGALSRGVAVALLGALPHARPEGLSAQAGRPPVPILVTAMLSAAVGALASLVLPLALLAIAAAVVAGLAVGWLARRQIGGITGDVLGTAVEIAEVLVLLTICAAVA